MPFTYNSFIDSVQTNFAQPHLQIKRFEEGFYEDMQNFASENENVDYPILWIVPIDVTHTAQSVAEYNLRVYALDLLEKDLSNERDVLSDTLSISRDFVNWIRLNQENNINIVREPRSNPVKSVMMDFTAGWYTDMIIEVETEGSDCSIPFSGNPTGSTIVCPQAFIYNSGSTYTVYVDSGDDFMLPNVTHYDSDGDPVVLPAMVGFTASTCPDVTIYNSGNTYTLTLPAGSNYQLPNQNINTKTINSAIYQVPGMSSPLEFFVANSLTPSLSNYIGSITQTNPNNISVFVSGSSLFINSVNIGSTPATVQANINVTLNGVQSGTWVSSANTWSVTASTGTTIVPTLSLSASSLTPIFNNSVTLIATPTDIIPTGYTWYANGVQIGSGSSLNWVVSILGGINIICIATDGILSTINNITLNSIYVRRTSIYTDGVNDFVRGWWNMGSAGGRALTASFYLKYVSGSAFFLQIGETVDGQNYVFLVQPSSTGPAFNFRIGAGGGFYGVSQTVTANVWYHIVMTYKVSGWSSPNPLAIYVNGVSIYSSGSASGMLQIVKPSIQLGVPSFGGAASVKFNGLSLFEDCISSAQTATLYNGGVALDNPLLTGVNRSEYFGGLETAQVPSTNPSLPYTKVIGVNGGVLNCNNNFASPYGLVTDIP